MDPSAIRQDLKTVLEFKSVSIKISTKTKYTYKLLLKYNVPGYLVLFVIRDAFAIGQAKMR